MNTTATAAIGRRLPSGQTTVWATTNTTQARPPATTALEQSFDGIPPIECFFNDTDSHGSNQPQRGIRLRADTASRLLGRHAQSLDKWPHEDEDSQCNNGRHEKVAYIDPRRSTEPHVSDRDVFDRDRTTQYDGRDDPMNADNDRLLKLDRAVDHRNQRKASEGDHEEPTCLRRQSVEFADRTGIHRSNRL